jgi:hypothetical protein
MGSTGLQRHRPKGHELPHDPTREGPSGHLVTHAPSYLLLSTHSLSLVTSVAPTLIPSPDLASELHTWVPNLASKFTPPELQVPPDLPPGTPILEMAQLPSPGGHTSHLEFCTYLLTGSAHAPGGAWLVSWLFCRTAVLPSCVATSCPRAIAPTMTSVFFL